MDPRQLGLSDDDLEALGYQVRREAPGGPAVPSEPSPGAVTGPPRPALVRSRTASTLRRWSWTVVVLVASVWAASSWRQRPTPIPANRPDTVFSSARAMSQLVDIARAPRPPGSAEHDRVLRQLIDRLRALGLEPEVQTGVASGIESSTADVATVQNVIARLPGTASTGAILLTASYDGPPLSSAAGDDGVGVAAILETLRVLRAGAPLRNDLIILFADGEDLGAMGTRVFLESHPIAADVDLAVALDMLGVTGPAWMVERLPANGSLIDAVAPTTGRMVAHSIARALPIRGGRATTRDLLQERGVPTLDLVGAGGREAHGGALDRAERVSERTLAHEGVQLVALARSLGARDLGTARPEAGGEVAYFSLSRIGVVSYPAPWTILLTAGLWLVWIALVLLFRVRGGDVRRLLSGTGLGAVVVGIGATAGLALVVVLARLHPEFGRLDGAVFHDGIHVAALATLTFGLTVLVYGLARLRFDRAELYLGALLLPLALLAWTTVRAPLAGPALQLPLVVALLHATVVVLFFSNRLGSGWVWFSSLLASGVLLFLAIPGLEWTVTVLTPRHGVQVGMLLAVAVLLVLPIADWMLAPRLWLTPFAATVTALILVMSATPRIQGEERHPELTSLVLLVDDSMTAVVDLESHEVTPADVPSSAQAAAADTLPTRSIPGSWLTVRGSGEAWARSWAVPGALTTRPPEGLLLPEGFTWEAAGAGPPARLALPRVRITRSERAGREWLLTVVVRSGLDGGMVGVRLPDGVAGSVTAVDGRALIPEGGSDPAEEGRTVRAARYWGRAEVPGVRFDIRLQDDAAAPVSIDIVEHHLRPREVLGGDFFERDRTVLPDAATGSDRMIQRTSLRLTPPAAATGGS